MFTCTIYVNRYFLIIFKLDVALVTNNASLFSILLSRKQKEGIFHQNKIY